MSTELGVNLFGPEGAAATAVKIALKDPSNKYALYATAALAGATPPTTAEVYAKGCIFTDSTQTDGTAPTWFNIGSAASPSWSANTGVGDITSVVAGAGLSGGATSGAATVTLGVGTSNGTASGNAVTLNTIGGVITSSTNNLAAATSETITLTNSTITANSRVLATIADPGTGGIVIAVSAKPTSGSCAIVVRNIDGSNAMTSVYKVAFFVYN